MLPGFLAFFFLISVAVSHADDIICRSGPGCLNGNDSIDWAQNYGPPYNSIPNNSTATSSVFGIKTQVTFMGGGDGERLDQGNGWWGNFSPGDGLAFTNDPGQGPLMLTFNTPVFGIGANIQGNAFGPFTATLQVFNSQHSLVDSFSEAGVSNGNNDGSAIFIGLANESPFTSAEFTVSYSSGGMSGSSFSVNRIGFAVPEPASLTLLCSGLGLVFLYCRRWL